MTSQSAAFAGLGWILLHFVAYAVLGRFIPRLQREAGILGYHAISFALLSALGLAVAVVHSTAPIWAAATFVVCLHGIYSLSFLELWSLAEGGYSLRLLDQVERGQKPSGGSRDLGKGKLEKRMGSLRRLGLVRDTPSPEPTGRGRIIGGLLSAILRLSGGQSINR